MGSNPTAAICFVFALLRKPLLPSAPTIYFNFKLAEKVDRQPFFYISYVLSLAVLDANCVKAVLLSQGDLGSPEAASQEESS